MEKLHMFSFLARATIMAPRCSRSFIFPQIVFLVSEPSHFYLRYICYFTNPSTPWCFPARPFTRPWQTARLPSLHPWHNQRAKGVARLACPPLTYSKQV